MNRRTLLAAVGAGAAALAGCAGDAGPDVGLGEAGLLNERPTAVSVRVRIERDGELRYETTHDLAGSRGTTGDAIKIVEPWMGDPTRSPSRRSAATCRPTTRRLTPGRS